MEISFELKEIYRGGIDKPVISFNEWITMSISDSGRYQLIHPVPEAYSDIVSTSIVEDDRVEKVANIAAENEQICTKNYEPYLGGY